MIFISYSWFDRQIVEHFVDYLNRQRVDYWLDSENLLLEQPLGVQIETAIGRSVVLVLINSAHSRSSPWVKFEIELAMNRGMPVVEIDAPGVLAAPVLHRINALWDLLYRDRLIGVG